MRTTITIERTFTHTSETSTPVWNIEVLYYEKDTPLLLSCDQHGNLVPAKGQDYDFLRSVPVSSIAEAVELMERRRDVEAQS